MINFFGVNFSGLSRDALLRDLMTYAVDHDKPASLVITPNLDHLVKLESDSRFAQAYASATWVVADGWPIHFCSRIFKKDIGDLFPGSDLVPAIFDRSVHLQSELKIYLLGAPPGVNEIAKSVIEEKWPTVKVVSHSCPQKGFLNDQAVIDSLVDDINFSSPDFVLLALGAPTQEVFFMAVKNKINHGVFLAVGATTEFIAGTVKRAPVAFRKAGLEWFYRMCSDPKRLMSRYIKCAIFLPYFFVRELFR